jgi:hypothetical protein
MSEEIPPGEFQTVPTKSREFLVNGQVVKIEWLPFDFSQWKKFAYNDPINEFGVFCPTDTNKPIQIGIRASDEYAAWATLHEQMCQRGDLIRLFPALKDSEIAAENHHPEHCRLVEETIEYLMGQNPDDNYDFESYRRDRIEMFHRILQPDVPQLPETKIMLEVALEYLESLSS